MHLIFNARHYFLALVCSVRFNSLNLWTFLKSARFIYMRKKIFSPKEKRQRKRNFFNLIKRKQRVMRRSWRINMITPERVKARACQASISIRYFVFQERKWSENKVQIAMRLFITFCNLISQKHIEFHTYCRDAAAMLTYIGEGLLMRCIYPVRYKL